MKTVWKKLDVIGPECEISNHGEIRQKRMTIRGLEFIEVLRKTYEGYKGRATIVFRQEGKQMNRYVHLLYAKAFCENDDVVNKRHVIALDGDYRNLTPENIKWVSAVELPKHPRPYRPGKLSEEQKTQLRKRLANGDTKQYLLAKEFGVSESLVSRIKA